MLVRPISSAIVAVALALLACSSGQKPAEPAPARPAALAPEASSRA